MQDFLDSMNHVRPSGEASVQYLRDFDPLTYVFLHCCLLWLGLLA
jgi:hypothetical protein